MGQEMLRFHVAELARPVLERLPRGGDFLYRSLLGPVGASFRGDAVYRARLGRRFRVFFDRHIGAYVAVDLADWACRAHFFRGRYYDVLVPALVDAWLGGRGVFVDVGANRGLHSLYAARRLGEGGRVYAFEPNPETFAVLQAHLAINHITNCTSYQMGLSDAEGTLELHGFADEHSGTCSFLPTSQVVRSFAVPVRPLDEVVGELDPEARVLMKIDTEGFEYKVVCGAKRVLGHRQVMVVAEMTETWLRAAGASGDELLGLMEEMGYRAYLPVVERRRGGRRAVRLSPLGGVGEGQFQQDVVFARGDLGAGLGV